MLKFSKLSSLNFTIWAILELSVRYDHNAIYNRLKVNAVNGVWKEAYVASVHYMYIAPISGWMVIITNQVLKKIATVLDW